MVIMYFTTLNILGRWIYICMSIYVSPCMDVFLDISFYFINKISYIFFALSSSFFHATVPHCLLSIIIFPVELDSFHSGFSLLQGKAGSPGERGPPGKPVSIVCHRKIFFHGFNFRAFSSVSLSKTTSLCPLQTTQTCKMSSHPLLNVMYVIIALGVCQ